MRVGVLGAGRMGRALGRRWSRSGHAVTYCFTRDEAKLDLEIRDDGDHCRVSSPRNVAAESDAVLLAIPWASIDHLVAQTGNLDGKIVMSCMLPMMPDDQGLAIGLDDSGAEALLRRLPGIQLVAIFNTVPSEAIAALAEAPERARPQVIFCGDETEAKTIAMSLSHDIGFEPVDVGGLRLARLVEPFGLLVGQLAYQQAAYGAAVAYRFSAAEALPRA